MPISWIDGLIGGALIGSAATLTLLFLGRVMGVSGIVSGAVFPTEPRNGWRWAFLAGLLAGGPLFAKVVGIPVTLPLDTPMWSVAAAGLLVGFGVTLGSGCTSGHGVCGLSRLAPRSFIATATFLFSGMLSVFFFKALDVLP